MQTSTLDDDFSALIESLPDSLFRAADRHRIPPELSRDPYKALVALRDREGPVVRRVDDGTFGGVSIPNMFLHDEAKPMFVVLGYDAHMAITLDPESFANGHGAYGATADAVGRIPTLMDGAAHTRLRRLFVQVFNRPAVQKRLASVIDPILTYLGDRMEDRFASGQPVDAARDLAMPLVYRVMSEFLGLPNEHFSFFIENGEAMFNAPTDPERGMAAASRLLTFFLAEVEQRHAQPRQDVLTWMTEVEVDGERLSDDEVAELARFMLPAGIETTMRAISLMILTLLSERERWEDVVAHPELMPAAIEECSRYSPSGFVIARMTVRDAEIAGVAIPAGSGVVSFQGIINRDPARWPDPDRFDIRRARAGHLTFNAGIHTCAGIHLAKAEMSGALTLLTERFPKLRLAVDPADIQIEGLQIRNPVPVPLMRS
jgi:cytochrome P450